jgi:hypothetical protein
MGNETLQEANTLVFILSQVLQGSSLQLLMNVESGNGYEAWRLLSQREEPQSGTAREAQLTGLLRTQFAGGMKSYEEELERFEGHVRRYELTYNEPHADSVHQALLKTNAPPEIRTQIELQEFFSANDLYTALIGFVRTRDSYAYSNHGTSSASAAAPIEFGAIMKGKGGKKGGSKGKEKGSSTTRVRRQGQGERRRQVTVAEV